MRTRVLLLSLSSPSPAEPNPIPPPARKHIADFSAIATDVSMSWQVKRAIRNENAVAPVHEGTTGPAFHHRSQHPPVDYTALLKARDTWANWTASLCLLTLIVVSSAVNLYYQLRYHNNLQVTFADHYSSDKEWLFGPEFTGPLNITLIYAFIQGGDSQDISRLKAAIQTAKPEPINNSTQCVADVGLDAGSLYAFCDQLDPRMLPIWAHEFEALFLQTIYLATVEQYKHGHATPFLGITQGFRNLRTGWYQQESIDRLYCTTKRLAGATSTNLDDRILFTRAHGVLRSVDCTAGAEVSNVACQAIHTRKPFVLFSDGTGMLRAYEVVRTLDGRDYILSPFSSKERIGERTDLISVWPFDDCLYVREGSLGWFGAGYLTYYPQIPKLALVAKIQLMGMLFVVWFVKYRCALYRVHHALRQLSRLGFFLFLVVEVVGSAYQEHDIMRTIYSWEIRSIDDWVLFWYIESTIALAGGLLALAVLRALLGSALCRVGVMMTMALPFVIGCTELWIARTHYNSYTAENGLITQPSMNCGAGYTGCGPGKFNYLHCAGLLTLLPAFVELARKWMRSDTHVHSDQIGQVKSIQPVQLTTFELICLDKTAITRLVRDCDEPYVDIAGVRHVNAILVRSCGFTVIKDRFLVRTKDLVFLLASAVLPTWVLRDVSVVLWPLHLCPHGTIGVSPPRKVFLKYIHSVAISRAHENASLIHSEEQPLA